MCARHAEGVVAVRQIDNADVLAKQKARLAAVRAARDPAKVRAALAALEAGARAPAGDACQVPIVLCVCWLALW